MPRGGRRPGSGRKPKPAALRAIDGGAAHRVEAYRPVSVVPPSTNSDQAPAVDEFQAPDSLGPDERKVWLRQSPFAFKARTLTPATALSFERYCRMVVLEAAMAVDVEAAGGSNHRGILQRINALELQFMLTPCGKALIDAADQPAAPANPLDRFLKRATR